MPPQRRIATGLTATWLALLAAGCGSSGSSPASTPPTIRPASAPLSAAAYRNDLHQVAQEEGAAQHHVQQAFHAHTVTQIRAALATFAADQRHAATRLTALTPPADAVAANTQLARAFTANATAIKALLTKLNAAKTVKQSLSTIQRDQAAQRVGEQIDAALAKLRRLGYTSGT